MQQVFPSFLPQSNWKLPKLSDLPDLSAATEIGIDVETRDPRLLSHGPGGIRRDGFITGIAIGVDGFRTYLPIRHISGNLPFENVQRWVSDQLARPNQPKVTANGGYDREWLLTDGIQMHGLVFDVQIAECLINEEQESYSLDNISKRWLGEGKEETLLKAYAKAMGWLNAKAHMHELPSSLAGEYAEADIDRTLRTFKAQKVKLLEDDLWPIFMLETELSEVVFLMRQQGVRFDEEGCEALAKKYRLQETETYERLREKYFPARRIDFNSAQDIASVCEELGFEDYPKTSKGNPSFIGDWMDMQSKEAIGSIAEFFHGISDFRTIEKLRRDFLEGAFKMTYKGRIHAQFNQLRTAEGDGTRSGRFSCSLPNLQQVPKRSKFAKDIRTLFLPDEGCEWVKLDYSQQEYRIFVHLAMVMGLEGAQEAGQVYIDNPEADFHKKVAEMTGLIRDDAKNLNFAGIYGAGEDKFAKMNKKTVAETAILFKKYHENVPFAKQLAKDATMRASTRGWIRTIGGRVLHFETYEPSVYLEPMTYEDCKKKWPKDKVRKFKGGFIPSFDPLPIDKAESRWPNVKLRRAQTHKSLNRYVQGSGADMTKIAMRNGYRDHKIVPLMQVHDELSKNGDRSSGLVYKSVMESAIKLRVPVFADLSIGKSWGRQTKVTL